MSTPKLTSDDPVELLVRLVETPSVSGSEAAVVGFVEAQLGKWGVDATVSGRNVWCAVEGERPGPTLLMEAHIDTVPPSPDWTSDPWRVARDDGKLRGLGANDVKGGVAAMMCAVRELRQEPTFAGTVLFAATCDEETGGEGLEVLQHELPDFAAAVIAEPTLLQVACAQRGLMRVEIACEGRAAHAARPWQGVNAIELAMQDIAALNAIEAPNEHPLLGKATLAATRIDAGKKPNVIPARCHYTLDVRPTPEYDNAWWEEQIRGCVNGRIEELKSRIVPVETSPDDPLVQAALAATGTGAPVPFGGVSDLFYVRDKPGIVLGPGRPEQSHQPDEWVEESQVRKAVGVYVDLVRRYLA